MCCASSSGFRSGTTPVGVAVRCFSERLLENACLPGSVCAGVLLVWDTTHRATAGMAGGDGSRARGAGSLLDVFSGTGRSGQGCRCTRELQAAESGGPVEPWNRVPTLCRVLREHSGAVGTSADPSNPVPLRRHAVARWQVTAYQGLGRKLGGMLHTGDGAGEPCRPLPDVRKRTQGHGEPDPGSPPWDSWPRTAAVLEPAPPAVPPGCRAGKARPR